MTMCWCRGGGGLSRAVRRHLITIRSKKLQWYVVLLSAFSLLLYYQSLLDVQINRIKNIPTGKYVQSKSPSSDTHSALGFKPLNKNARNETPTKAKEYKRLHGEATTEIKINRKRATVLKSESANETSEYERLHEETTTKNKTRDAALKSERPTAAKNILKNKDDEDKNTNGTHTHPKHKPLHTPNITGVPFCTVPNELPGVLRDRAELAKSVCTRLHQNVPKKLQHVLKRDPSAAILSKLRWDTYNHLIYCPIPKVASKTWAWHLLRASGVSEREIGGKTDLQTFLKRTLTPPIPMHYEIGFITPALKFLFTRHPYERLVAVYTQNRQNNESFPDFVKGVLSRSEAWLKDLKNTPPPDSLIAPMTFLCAPCGFQYDVFGKLETMETDVRFIANQCGLSEIIKQSLNIPSELKHNITLEYQDKGLEYNNGASDHFKNRGFEEEEKVSKTNGKGSDSNDNRGREGFSSFSRQNIDGPSERTSDKNYKYFINQLSAKDKKRLYKLYRYDFEIFGYAR